MNIAPRIMTTCSLRVLLLAASVQLALPLNLCAQQEELTPPAPGLDRRLPSPDESLTGDEVAIPIRNQIIPTDMRMRVGEWWLSLFASELVQYDDNIFLEQRGTDSDFISLTTAGATLSRRGAEMEAALTAAVSGEVFLHEGEENTWGGYLQGGIRFGFGHGYVRLFDTLSRRKEAIQFTDVQGSTVIAAGANRTEQLINEGGIDLGYDWEKFGLAGKYANSLWEYGRDLDALDAVGHTVTGIAKYFSTAKLELNAQLERRSVGFDQDVQNDFTVNGAFFGLRWQASEKVALRGRLGYLAERSDSGGAVGDDDEYQGGAGDVAVTWAVTEKTEAELAYVHDLYIAAGNNFQVVDLVRATMSWDVAPRWKLRGRVPVQFSHPSSSDDSTIWGLGLSVAWRPQAALELTLSYDYQARSTGELNSDFTNNRLGLQASLQF